MERVDLIFLDMDGVLANFDKYFVDNIGHTPQEYIDKYGKSNFWAVIHSKHPDLFQKLEPYPHAKELLALCQSKAPTVILSSPPAINRDKAVRDKISWLKEHGLAVPAIFETEKYKHASSGALLIDDMKKNTEPFEKAGGQVLLFKDFASAKKTLEGINK